MGSMEEAAVALAAASDTCDTNPLQIVREALSSGVTFVDAAGDEYLRQFGSRFGEAMRELEGLISLMLQLGSDLEQAARRLAGS
jgi:hypothetical protein